MFRGTLTQTSVYPREVVKRALDLNAGGGDPRAQPPVGRGRAVARRRVPDPDAEERAALVDVRVLDHLVVGARAGGVVRRAGAAVSRPALNCARRPRRRCSKAMRERRARGGRRRGRARARRPRAQQRERDLFALSVGPVVPLRRCARAALRAAAPAPGAAPARARRGGGAAPSRSPTSSTSRRCSTPTRRCRSAAAASGPRWCASCAAASGRSRRQLDLHGLRRDEARERARRLPARGGAQRPALRARDPRQGQRLAGPRAGAQGQGAQLAGAEERGDRLHAGARAGRRARRAARAAEAAGTGANGPQGFRPEPPLLRIQSAVPKKACARRSASAGSTCSLAHRLRHARQPLVALADADRERQVARAQPRVAEAVDVVLRPAQPAAEEPEQLVARAVSVRRMHRAQRRVTPAPGPSGRRSDRPGARTASSPPSALEGRRLVGLLFGGLAHARILSAMAAIALRRRRAGQQFEQQAGASAPPRAPPDRSGSHRPGRA